jgi:beta-glucanase (GH16 family)
MLDNTASNSTPSLSTFSGGAFAVFLFAALLLCCVSLHAQAPASIDLSGDPLTHGVTPTGPEATATSVQNNGAPAWLVTIQPTTKSYPGIDIVPPGGKFDASKYGRVDARLVNTTSKKFRISLRLDNDGDWKLNPWNAEILTLLPGKPMTVSVYFGLSFGRPAFALNPEAITHIKVIAGKSTDIQSFRIESISAAGKPGEGPPIDPASLRFKPVAGVLFGKDVAFDATKQLSVSGGAKSSPAPGDAGIEANFTGSNQAVLLKPAIGRWDLRDYNEVTFTIKNIGKTAVIPSALVNSNDGPTDGMAMSTPLRPGEERSIEVSFIPVHPWLAKPASSPQSQLWNGQPNSGTNFASDKVSALAIGAENVSGTASLLIENITAGAPPVVMPTWLGKRPPVDGNWKMSFDEEFNGNFIDDKKWNVHGDNYYDQRSHWTKDDVIVSNGVATFRYEKKTGFQNDDPTQKQTDYASGFLDSFGKFTQRYGYFEVRMKLPKAPGLWPAFWMMPDRGPAGGDKYKRLDTHNGGMEIDIMEFLSRWGVYRYNTAFHWDGYNKDHRQTGNQKNYVQADKDGYITPGVLWEPGLIVFYCNGKELDRFEDPRVPSTPEEFLFTQPSGGWDNDQLDDKQLPSDWKVDYVRAWSLKDYPTDPGKK